jgi:hypothetical protein
MNEKEIKSIIDKDKMEVVPPEGLKDKIFRTIMGQIYDCPALSPLESFVFRSPLRVALAFAAFISATLWISMGNEFSEFINRIIG